MLLNVKGFSSTVEMLMMIEALMIIVGMVMTITMTMLKTDDDYDDDDDDDVQAVYAQRW